MFFDGLDGLLVHGWGFPFLGVVFWDGVCLYVGFCGLGDGDEGLLWCLWCYLDAFFCECDGGVFFVGLVELVEFGYEFWWVGPVVDFE